MNTKITCLIVSFILVVALIMTSCAQKTPEETQITTTATTTQVTSVKTTQTTTIVKTTTPTTTAKETPQYGGKINLLDTKVHVSWDPGEGQSGSKFLVLFMYERLLIGDWAKSIGGSNQWSFILGAVYTPMSCVKGNLAESWETPDPLTVIYHIRKGVNWALDPASEASKLVNGRELTADDVAWSLNRYISNSAAAMTGRPYVQSFTATDKWTVVQKMKSIYYDPIESVVGYVPIHPREVVDKYGNLKDWRNAVGTGAYILSDYASDSATYKKNPNYWNNDELHSNNRLPYIDTVKTLFITDRSTIQAGLRTRKIDLTINDIFPVEQESLEKTNPELKYVSQTNPQVLPWAIFKCDESPFNNEKVRVAMNMAIDFETIVKTYYNGKADYWNWPCSIEFTEYYRPLNQMPADIQEIYTYHSNKAKQLLAEAGYSSGFTVDITTSQQYSDPVAIFQSYWKAIGVNVNMKLVDDTSLTALRTANSKWHGILAVQSGWDFPGYVITYPRTGNSYNYYSFSDPSYDKSVDELVSIIDTAKFKAKIFELADYLLRRPPFIISIKSRIYTYWQPWVKGCHGEYGLGAGSTYDISSVIARFWMDQDLKNSMGK